MPEPIEDPTLSQDRKPDPLNRTLETLSTPVQTFPSEVNQSLDRSSVPFTPEGEHHTQADNRELWQVDTESVDLLPQIAGYDITGEIARGGMGRILSARDRTLQREVAIKILRNLSNALQFPDAADLSRLQRHDAAAPGSVGRHTPVDDRELR